MRRKKTITALLIAILVLVSFTYVKSAEAQSTCPKYEYLLKRYSPGWDVSRMSRYMYRESNCIPWVRSSSNDSGLLQINDVNHPYLRQVLHQWVDSETLKRPVQNIRAAAALCVYWIKARKGCYYPWGG